MNERLGTLALVALGASLLACGQGRDDVVGHLPTCARACVAELPNANTVELDGQHIRLWAAGVEDRALEATSPRDGLEHLERLESALARQLGMMPGKVFHALCRRDTPASALEAMLEAAGPERFTALALGGSVGGSLRFATVRRWTPAQATADVASGAALMLTPQGVEAVPACASSPTRPCPVVLVEPGERTCGQLMAVFEQGAASGHLFGVVVP